MPKRMIPMQLCGGAIAHVLWKGCTPLGSPEFVERELGKVA